MSTVLTINPGSSSLQAHLVSGDTERVLDQMHVEAPPDSEEAAAELRKLLFRVGDRELTAVAHRLVHGGEAVRAPTVVTDELVRALDPVAALAPLHVPRTLALLAKLRGHLSGVPHVLCPDTAFHNGLSDLATTYPLPAEWRQRFGLRRYGFHGLSYAHAVRRVAAMTGVGEDRLSLLLAHLGGGCSVCAYRDGRSVDTSMGFTPLEGVPMSKRSGSIDPGLLLHLLEKGLTREQLSEGLYRQSGLLGLSDGRSGDTRELVAAARDGDPAADLALRVFAHRVARELAAAATSLYRVDALVFTGEIGWDQPELREAITARLGQLGVRPAVADNREDDGPVHTEGVPVLVVKPREELQLCRDALTVV
ncbi:acetate kinase [Crossiella sp. CA-258035]|uniref:acetate/propionate family kinase n=1 Tax=Crossiella sp. CA-258035 TaxID=2981138 RepID=UPI0024BC4EF4|nr:acetate kinase [Crossiella sp. CA-258035]WHT15949.1 acetate kinase [Crossiella sp. CA-258035]